jgi:hypothetical protein
MNVKVLILSFLFFYSLSFSDDIYLKKGQIVKNVKILEEDNFSIKIKTTLREYKISRVSILKIVKKPYEPNIETEVISPNGLIMEKPIKSSTPKTKKVYKNFALLPVGVLAFFLSYDYLKEASDIQDSIEEYQKLKLNLGDLESKKDRKMLVGIGCITIGIIASVIAIMPEEVEISQNEVTLSFKF